MIGIYCRVSTDKQEDGYSLDVQQDEGIRYAELQGQPYRLYVDVESGTSAARLDKLKADIASGTINTVWVIHNDRLTRLAPQVAFDFRDYLIRYKVRVIERDHDFDIKSLLVYGVNAIVNYDFIERLRSKTKDGKQAQRNSGRASYPNLYGYIDTVKGTGKNGRVVREWNIDPEKADVIKIIFKLNTEDKMGLAAICKHLNKLGYKSQNNRPFEPSAVSRILQRIEYSGKTKTTDGTIIDSLVYAPIIDFETWEKAQNSYIPVITNNSKRGRHAEHAMTNILHCFYCDAGYYYHYGKAPYTWKDGSKTTIRTRHTYYHRHTSPCLNKRKNFDMHVLDAIGLIIYRRAMTEQSTDLLESMGAELKHQIENNQVTKSNIEKDITKLKKEISNFENAIASGLDINIASRNINQRKHGVGVLEKELDALEAQDNSQKADYEAIRAEFAVSKVDEYIASDSKGRRNLLARILKQGLVKDDTLIFKFIDGREYTVPYSAFAKMYKNLISTIGTLDLPPPSKDLYKKGTPAVIRDLLKGNTGLLVEREYWYLITEHIK